MEEMKISSSVRKRLPLCIKVNLFLKMEVTGWFSSIPVNLANVSKYIGVGNRGHVPPRNLNTGAHN